MVFPAMAGVELGLFVFAFEGWLLWYELQGLGVFSPGDPRLATLGQPNKTKRKVN